MPDSSQIRRVLHAVRRRRRALSLASGAMAVASVLLLIVIASAAGGEWVTVVGPVRVVFLSASLAAIAIATLRCLLALVSHQSDDAVALEIEKTYPGLRSRLISSVQLQREMEAGTARAFFSEPLIDALVADTEEDAARLNAVQVDHGAALKRNGALLGVCLVGTLFAAALFPARFGASLRGIFHPSLPTTEIAAPAEKGSLVMGDITLHYSYPAYSRLSPRTVRNSSGAIRALRGTEVRIAATVAGSITAANLVLNGTEQIPMTVSDGSREALPRIEGRLGLTGEGFYQFEATPANGGPCLDRKKREIAIEPDERPKVDLVWPAESIEATERDVIDVTYDATDDFGLTELALVVKIGDKEKRIELASLSSAPTRQSDTYKWRLADLDLDRVQELAYFIEARDNDNISGPKIGKSEMRHIAIQNARSRHEEIIGQQEKLLKKMLHLLALDLTSPLDAEKGLTKRAVAETPRNGDGRRGGSLHPPASRVGDAKREGAESLPYGSLDAEKGLTKDRVMLIESSVKDSMMSVLDLLNEVLSRMKEDPLANYAVFYALEDMRAELDEIGKRRMRASFVMGSARDKAERPATDGGSRPKAGPFVVQDARRSETVPAGQLSVLSDVQREQIELVEKDVLVLDGLIGKQRLENIQLDVKRLAELKEKLAKLLERMEKGADAAQMKELQELMAEIEELVRKIAAETMKLAQDMPIGAFLNPDAMAAPGDVLQKIREALARGDREEAMRLARQMMGALDGLSASLGNANRRYSSAAYSGMVGQMNDLMRRLDELAQAETGLLKQTKDVKKAIQERTHGDTDDKLSKFFEEQLERRKKIESQVNGANSTLGADRDVKEYTQKEDERRAAVDQKYSMLGYFGTPRPADLGRKLKEKLDELTKEIEEATKALAERKGARDLAGAMKEIPQLKEQLRQLEEMLRARDVQESSELAQDVRDELSKWENSLSDTPKEGRAPACRNKVKNQLGDAAEEAARMVADLEKMRRWIEGYQRGQFRPNERKKMEELAGSQRGVMGKTEKLKEEIDELQKRSPFMKDDVSKDMNGAAQRMDAADGKLQGERPGSAVTEEREAVYQLEQAKSHLQKAQERIAQGMMGEGMEMPQDGNRCEGLFGVRLEKFPLPSPDQYKVPKEFREDILDAMDGSAPKQYRKPNKDYYKRLLEQ